MFHDEPTIESLSMMGLAVASVGNHEFDEGKDELLRMQNGGCHPIDNCQGPHPFLGAKFHYLAASTIEKSTGKTIFPRLRDPGVRRHSRRLHRPDVERHAEASSRRRASPDLEFRDEADTVNALVPELKARGVEAIVVLIHEGGFPTGDYNECPGISGPIVDIVRKFDRAVDVVVSGHTHQPYVCEIDGRLVTSRRQIRHHRHRDRLQARSASTRDVISAKADNVIVRTGAYAKDPEQTALLRILRQAGRTDRRPPGGLGHRNAVARAQRAPARACSAISSPTRSWRRPRADANGGAVIAFTNPGGIRSDIPENRTAR